MTIDPSIFRDYDIRGVVPEQLDEAGFARIMQALIKIYQPKTVQIGRDMRTTSPAFHKAAVDTFLAAGVNVVDLGLIATDMLYYAAGTHDADLAMIISASHNPPQYNGMKLVKKGAIAVSGDSGIYDIRDLAVSSENLLVTATTPGTLTSRDIMADWVAHVLKFIDVSAMKPLKVVIDAGNGMAGHFMPPFLKHLPWITTNLYFDLDGTFPNHVPSPIEEKNMQATITTVLEQHSDLGMAFDGDGDRVFLVDEEGIILSGTIMTAIIAENLLQKSPNQAILYNAIVGRVVPEVVNEHGGKPIRVRVGHTLIKEAMRASNGLFCGEHSGHYFFRDNFFADSAIIAVLLVLELMSKKNMSLSQLRKQYDKYPASREINFKVPDKKTTMEQIEAKFKPTAQSTDWLDGVSVWYPNYWFNVRPSNTEPLLRLNIEADTQELVAQVTQEMVATIESLGGQKHG